MAESRLQPVSDNHSAFLDFVVQGNKERCKEYLNEFPEAIHSKNRRGETPLHIAAKDIKDSTMFCLLLEFQPNINARNFWGQTPLHYAAEALAVPVIKLLLQHPGVDVTVRDINGYTVLHSFVNSNFWSFIVPNKEWEDGLQTLIASGIDVNSQTKFGHSILHLVSASSKYPTTLSSESNTFLKCILENCENIKLDLRNYMEQTFFHSYIVSSIFLELCEWLPREDIRELLNHKDVRGISPWFIFLSDKTLSTTDSQIKSLLELGGSVTSVDNLSNTVLHINRRYSVLVGNRADINATNIFGISAASTGGVHLKGLQIDTINFALKDRWYRTPLVSMLNNEELMRNVSSENTFANAFDDVLKYLAVNGKGFNINDQDRFGTTLLHLAAYHDDATAVKILLRRGANPDILDNEMETPFETAVKFGNFKCLPIFPNKIKFPVHLTKYAQFHKSLDMVYLSDIGDLNCVHKVVRCLPRDTEAFSDELLLKHHVQFANEAEEAYQVTSAVQKLVSRISAFVSGFDDRFSISVFRSGSSAEGTKVGRPDEFDFVLCLEALGSSCEVEMSSYPGFENCACLKFKDHIAVERFVSFCDEDNYFVSQPYLNYLFRYIQKALYQKELWENGQLLFQVQAEVLGFKAPVINLTVFWVGSQYKYMKISIDLVPAIYKEGWWPPGYLPGNVSDTVKDAGCFVLLESKSKNMKIDHSVMEDSIVNDFLETTKFINEKKKHQRRSYRISVARAEIALMRSLPENFRKAYALSKMFKSGKFTPILIIDKPLKLYQDRKIEGFNDPIDPSSDIKSYWIKNCVFYVADTQYERLKSASPFTITLQVYKQLLEFAGAGVFRPYLQRRTNLFEFQDEVDFKDDVTFRTINTTNFRLECLYRKICIEMVLGVLNCRMPAINIVKWLDACEQNYRKEFTPNAVDIVY